MLKDAIEVNQKVEISVGDNSVYYKSSVQDVGEDSFAIGIPDYKGNLLNLRQGDQVKVKLFTDRERYIFTATCLGKKEDRIPLYILSLPDKAMRLQDRDFVRVKTALEVFYTKASEKELELNLPLEPTAKGYSVDLSGGGLLLALDEKLSQNDILYLKFAFTLKDEEHLIQTYGKVVRLEPADNTKFKQLAGIKFVNLDEGDREKIIQFLFQRMRAQRRIKQ